MAEHGIELKGSSFTLSVVHMTDSDIQQVKRQLAEKIALAPAFFRAAPLVINIEKLLQIPDFIALADALKALDLVPVGITGAKDDATRAAARAAGLAVVSTGKIPMQQEATAAPAALLNQPGTKVHRGPVRSGQQVYAPNGSLVILGSVSNGAEVIADDSIHIYGQLRGRAVAGAKGNESARIYCQQLMAELISVAGHYQLSDGLQGVNWEQPVTISLAGEQLKFDRL
ncbi:septum site-determining protein MinC [Oceanisphaera arctica]|uniref:Probable septum site-determining protein MinC n=1 Tax=Oceanisphaera arctica TaxID=641510 RepID=A0A2P5TQM0_9GAMM|nr:septum site-determining protein MinC [Oceanisphaera arctica]PPL18043.1 septum site-determining protein MinC [Oceanisphaera arctica]GHA09430.1 putative septum site-determining protein MinC [Oceanisphaera arctica]